MTNGVKTETEDTAVVISWLLANGWESDGDRYVHHGAAGVKFVVKPAGNYTWHLRAVRAGRRVYVREVGDRANLAGLLKVLARVT